MTTPRFNVPLSQVDENFSLSTAFTLRAQQGEDIPVETKRSFGSSFTKTAFSSAAVLAAARKSDPEALTFLWQLQNVLEDHTGRRFSPEQMTYTVNVGTRCAEGRKLYIVTMDEPLSARIRLLRAPSIVEGSDDWDYSYEEIGRRRLKRAPRELAPSYDDTPLEVDQQEFRRNFDI